MILQYKNGDWSHFKVNKPVISLCMVQEEGDTLLLLSVDGNVFTARKEGFSQEVVAGELDDPDTFGVLTEIQNINRVAYAVGMGRQVYRRENSAYWVPIDKEVRQSYEDIEIKGFNAIDGFGSDDIYAVGYNGEIWHYDGMNWSQEKSPVTIILNKIICIAQDKIYAVGQSGTILTKTEGVWKVIYENVI